MTHPAAELLRAIADGKQMESSHKDSKAFTALSQDLEAYVKCSHAHALHLISQGCQKHLRIARPMVTREISYPEPLRVKPEMNQEYWMPYCGGAGVCRNLWFNHSHDNQVFAAGMAFATEADAAEAHKALFGAGT